MKRNKSSFIEEFKAQKAKFRPWAIVIAIDLLLALISYPVAVSFFDYRRDFAALITLIVALPLIVAIPRYIEASRCPNCRKYMGRDISKYCPVCGVQIQE